ncbi:MAG: hypothetical protein CMQ45_08920 [Gammaproteobacteria bacterium]|nr:hypothetical protein [Gammaproteobacteria bacterium]
MPESITTGLIHWCLSNVLIEMRAFPPAYVARKAFALGKISKSLNKMDVGILKKLVFSMLNLRCFTQLGPKALQNLP